jgi:hypothetical protein
MSIEIGIFAGPLEPKNIRSAGAAGKCMKARLCGARTAAHEHRHAANTSGNC